MRAVQRPPLLLVSSTPTPLGTATEDAPRLDYRELAVALGGAPLAFLPPRRGVIAMLESHTASDLRQAIDAFRRRRRYGAFVSFSEKVGLPLAVLLGRNRGAARTPHVLLAHHLTSDRKRRLQVQTGYLNRFDRIVVLCREQARYLIEEASVEPDRVRFVYYPVDSAFWRRNERIGDAGTAPAAPSVLSVGRERRDYPTLNRAARLLPDVRFTIVASSPWARGGGEMIGERGEQPEENVTIHRNVPYTELRTLYRRADAIVVPLREATAYAAGVNGVLEAMAMGHAPIVTRTPGIVDYIDDGVTGTLVPPDDPVALTGAIQAALSAEVRAAQRGAAARAAVVEGRDLETYVARLAQIVGEVMHGSR